MDPPTKFVSAKVKGIMDRILEENLTGKYYQWYSEQQNATPPPLG